MDARSLSSIGRTLLCAVAGFSVLAGIPAVVQAEPPKLISYGNFAGPGGAIGVAVDQSTGDVFATGLVDFSTGELGRIDKFDASGKLISPPSPVGEGHYAGPAVNPTNGDVYVVNNVENEGEFTEVAIETYDQSSGALLSSFSVPKSNNVFFGTVTAVQIAADAAGDVYVPVTSANEVQKYSPSGTLLQTFTGSGAGTLQGPTGVTVDSSGNVWVADTNDNRIEELSPSDTPLDEIKSEGVHAVALDPDGDVFAVVSNGADFCGSLAPPCSHLVEYSSTGARLADIGAGELSNEFDHLQFGLSSALAINDTTGRVYVTDSSNSRIWVFGPPTAPTVGNELTAEVSTSEAKLGALIDPGGINTTYSFEYGTTEAYGHTTPFPDGNVGEGVASRTVWASANGLAQGTTYHYRVVANNELGTSYGQDETFTTGTSEAASCPNEQLRSGFSARLPDCRAYELVTPPNKVSAQPDETSYLGAGGKYGNLAAGEGNRFAFVSIEAQPGSDSGGYEYLSTRGTSGWLSEAVLPRQSYTDDRCTSADTQVDAYSTDLKQAVLYDGGNEKAGEVTKLQGGCGAEPVEVVSGEPMGYENLLLRNNEDGTYQLINLTPPDAVPASAHFDGATSDLSHICFSEHSQLTPGAPAGVENEYEWTAGVLRLITASEPQTCNTSQEPEASGYIPNEASGYKYFVSQTVLTGGQENEYGEVAQNGQWNVYLEHSGETTFIATGGESDSCLGQGTACSRVSPNGRFFAFTSSKNLTGYENNGVLEIYLYTASTNQLACASCNPSGEAPTAIGAAIEHARNGGVPHYLANSGQLFFQTAEALLPSDTNGQEDVYEYESGQLHLISPGTSAKESLFLDASEKGDDVFLLTRLQLLPQATNEESLAIYDARVDGGFPELSSPPPCTTADSCRTPASPQPAIFGAPSSSTFSGVGNLAPSAEVKSKAKPKAKTAKCKKGFVKRKGKCVKKPTKKAKKSAHANKRTGK